MSTSRISTDSCELWTCDKLIGIGEPVATAPAAGSDSEAAAADATSSRRRRRKRARSRSRERVSSHAFFLDNSADNFIGCDRRVIRIKVDETENDETTAVRERALERTQACVQRMGDDTRAADVLSRTCAFVVDKLDDHSVVADPRAGITKAQFAFVAARASTSDLVFLDFDRALSVVEGFLFKTPRWDEYLLGAKANFGCAAETTVDDLIRAHLGGAARAEMVAEGLGRLIRSVGAANVYVLTNNCNVFLIEGVMAWLNDRMRERRWEASDARGAAGAAAPPKFADGHVLSTHAVDLVELIARKADVIHKVVEQTASGTIDATLLLWRTAAERLNVRR